MNENEKPEIPPAASEKRKPRFAIGCLAVGAVFMLLFVLPVVGAGFLEPIFALAFGWLSFLQRTLPRISWNWDVVGMGLLCVAFILLLAHQFLNWLAKNAARLRGASWRWPWKWTWCGLAAMMMFFLIGMAIGGMVHQIGWIVTSPEPWFEVKGRNFRALNDMRELEMAFRISCAETNGNNLSAFRKEFFQTAASFQTYDGKSWMETYQIYFVALEDQKVAGLIVFPRDADLRKRSGAIVSLNESRDIVPAERISEFMRTNLSHLVQF